MLKTLYNYKIRIVDTGKIREIYTYDEKKVGSSYIGPVLIGTKNNTYLYEVIELLSTLKGGNEL